MTLFSYNVIKQDISDSGIKFFFISKGLNEIIKVVEYTYLTDYRGLRLFNLGFGDYDVGTDRTNDKSNTANGDAYHVFNTVLHTVPKFFDSFIGAAIIVRGSDSADQFAQECRRTCFTSKCERICRKKHRRIKIYCCYISREYHILILKYDFFGIIKTDDGTEIERFVKNKFYESVLLVRR